MSPTPPTINLVHLARVTSTMDVLDELIADGAPDWTVVLADKQTGGLGRAGRSWDARPGSSLLCSILVRPPFAADRMGMLAIGVGVAIATCVERLGARVELKWPNDVLLGGRKLAGILIRTRSGATGVVANVGIGLNLIGTPREHTVRAALDEATETTPNAAALAVELASSLAQLLTLADISGIRDAWRERAALVGETVVVGDGERTVTGKLVGIDDHGALLIEGDDGDRHAIVAGDLVRGPRAEAG